MLAEPYIDKLHRPQMQRWLIKHQMAPMLAEDLPRIGFVVDGVAAGFLRVCEGSYGLIDAYITNPEAEPSKRNEGLELVTASILRSAKAMGIKKILCFTTDECIITRAKKHGFAHLPDTFLVLEVR